MEEIPDYTQYSLEDLIDTRERIDAEQFPQRASQLDLLIRDRTHRSDAALHDQPVPESPPIPQARTITLALPIPSPFLYRAIVLTALVILLIVNVLTLSQGRLLALVPISLQLTTLSLILLRYRPAILFVRLWSGILLASALFYWMSVLMLAFAGVLDPPSPAELEDKLSLAQIVWNTFELFGAWWVFHFARQALPEMTQPSEAS